VRRALRWAAAGAALPALFLFLLAAGLSSSAAAALCGALALLPYSLDRAPLAPEALAAGAAAALASALLVLPAAGIGGAAAVAAALACSGLSSRWGEPAGEPERPLPADAAAALFCGVALWRWASFLLGHSLYAAVIAAAGAGAGLAAGRAARARAAFLREALPGGGPLAAGLVGLLCLHWLRLHGLNDAQAERVRAPVLGWADGWLLAGQLFASFALWTAVLGALEERAPAPGRRARGARLAPLAAPLAAALLPVLGPDGCAAAGFAVLALAGAWRGLPRWRPSPVLSRAVPAALVAAAALAYAARGSLQDLTLARLDAVYPGGRVLSWSEGGGRALAVYQFSTGARMLLRDGVADVAGGEIARYEAYLPLLARGAKRALLVSALHPETAAAAANLGVETAYYDRVSCASALRALGAPAASTAAAGCGAWRPPAGPWDAVIVQADPPLWSPETAVALTREAARSWKRRMAPGGVLAWRVPAPLASPAAQRARAALQAEFKSVAEFEAAGQSVLMGAERLSTDAFEVQQRVTPALGEDFPDLRDKLLLGVPWKILDGPAALPAASAARPLTALPARLRL
jgi:hypothetical protein